MPLLASVKPLSPTQQAAERILAIAAQLPAEAQPVFAEWLVRHTQAGVPFPNKAGLAAWLASLSTGHAEAEYALILLEIAWLDVAAECAQLEFGETCRGSQKSCKAGD